MDEKKEALEKLKEEMERNADLPLAESARLVFGEGDAHAAVLFIGEAPGRREDELQRPFVGQSGKLLDKMLAKIGWSRERVYITNIVKRRPPENRDPSPQEIAAYQPYLKRQIEIIDPKVIVTLGRFSMNYFLPEATISSAHGTVVRIPGHERLVMPIYHPAAALRSGAMMKAFEADFQKLPEIVEKAETLLVDKSTFGELTA